MTSSSLSALLHLHGLPPLPRSLTGFVPQGQSLPYYGPSLTPQLRSDLMPSTKSGHGHIHGRPSPPVPPPRPHSRRSSSSGSSFRASPDHMSSRSAIIEPMRSSPRSLSSSPHSPYIDSGLGRSSADSFSEPRAFVRVVKSPGVGTKLDAQLVQLKKDMNDLRRQDMTLLGHLLQIHQGIQDLKNVLVPPPQPAPSSAPLSMFHSTPSYPSYHSSSSSSSSRHARKHHGSSSSYPQQQQQSTSRLSILTGGKLFSRRSSAEKMMVESLNMGMDGACGSSRIHSSSRGSRNPGDDESDSLSSLEFGDV